MKIIRKQGVWLELVNLVIPTVNDDPKDIKRMCEWIKENLGSYTPVHFSRFYPSYLLKNLSLTPISTLERAHEIAKKVGLEYATIGNVPGHKHNSTFCPKCGKRLVHRMHFQVMADNVQNGKCRFCGRKIPGIWV